MIQIKDEITRSFPELGITYRLVNFTNPFGEKGYLMWVPSHITPEMLEADFSVKGSGIGPCQMEREYEAWQKETGATAEDFCYLKWLELFHDCSAIYLERSSYLGENP